MDFQKCGKSSLKHRRIFHEKDELQIERIRERKGIFKEENGPSY